MDSRERHEVLEKLRPDTFRCCIRSERIRQIVRNTAPGRPVHRSLPPSPATLRDFVDRGSILETLWQWFVFGDQPRIYLHGTGGSGKSTIAFEFARTLSDHGGSVRAKNGDALDYVVYISGKETELDPQTGKEKPFAFQQFAQASEQYAQILLHSGFLNEDQISTVDENTVDALLTELFGNFSGLIVIDDIDALQEKRGAAEESCSWKADQSEEARMFVRRCCQSFNCLMLRS